jgi:hypothetical protein
VTVVTDLGDVSVVDLHLLSAWESNIYPGAVTTCTYYVSVIYCNVEFARRNRTTVLGTAAGSVFADGDPVGF